MLRMGHFKNFEQGQDAILISSGPDDLRLLADALRALEDALAEPVEIHALPFVTLHHPMRLTAFPVGVERGIERLADADGIPTFAWHHSEEGWLEAAEKIEAVAAGGPGHNYLVAQVPEDAIAIVSSGEYDDAWWEKTA